jgi:hypothetical protein
VVQDGRIVVLGRNVLGRMWMQFRDDMWTQSSQCTVECSRRQPFQQWTCKLWCNY